VATAPAPVTAGLAACNYCELTDDHYDILLFFFVAKRFHWELINIMSLLFRNYICSKVFFLRSGTSLAAPVLWGLQLTGTRSHLEFATLPLPIPSVVYLQLTAGLRLPPAAQPSASDSATGWHCALQISIYLLTYLFVYVCFGERIDRWCIERWS